MTEQTQAIERPIPPAAEAAFRKAKVRLISQPDSVFLTTLFFNMKQSWSFDVPEAKTNGLQIFYNPEHFITLNPDEQLSLMMEQTLHTAFLHMERMSDRDENRWQTAADEVARNTLAERGYKMHPERKFDTQYKGKSTEQVYNLLPVTEPPPKDSQRDLEPPPPQDQQGDDDGQGKGQGQPNQQAADQNLRAKVEDLLVQAAQAAQMAGNTAGSVPGEMQMFLDKLLNPVLPWHQILRKWMQSTAKTDYTYRKPNRRYYPEYYLPSMLSSSLVDVMVAVDISGSVSDEDFKQFVSETHQIMKVFKPKNIRFVQFDTRIHHDDNIRSLSDLKKLEFHGRGGTDPRCVLELANKVKPKVLLFFTDGEFYTEGLPDYKGNLVWLIHNNERFSAPYGKTIHYKL